MKPKYSREELNHELTELLRYRDMDRVKAVMAKSYRVQKAIHLSLDQLAHFRDLVRDMIKRGEL